MKDTQNYYIWPGHILLYCAHDFTLFSYSGKAILNNSMDTECLTSY